MYVDCTISEYNEHKEWKYFNIQLDLFNIVDVIITWILTPIEGFLVFVVKLTFLYSARKILMKKPTQFMI